MAKAQEISTNIDIRMITFLCRALTDVLGSIPGPSDMKLSKMNHFSEPV